MTQKNSRSVNCLNKTDPRMYFGKKLLFEYHKNIFSQIYSRKYTFY